MNPEYASFLAANNDQPDLAQPPLASAPVPSTPVPDLLQAQIVQLLAMLAQGQTQLSDTILARQESRPKSEAKTPTCPFSTETEKMLKNFY